MARLLSPFGRPPPTRHPGLRLVPVPQEAVPYPVLLLWRADLPPLPSPSPTLQTRATRLRTRRRLTRRRSRREESLVSSQQAVERPLTFAGIVIGCVAAIAALILLLFFFCVRFGTRYCYFGELILAETPALRSSPTSGRRGRVSRWPSTPRSEEERHAALCNGLLGRATQGVAASNLPEASPGYARCRSSAPVKRRGMGVRLNGRT